MTFRIEGERGDWAEADSLSAARLAARTLVEDGNDWASVYGPLDAVSLLTARRNEHGEIVLHGSTLTKKYERSTP